MPVAPYTWQLDDYLTASRLNAELYATAGYQFQPNGIGLHAAKPVYKSWLNQPEMALSSGSWFQLSEDRLAGDGWYTVQADTGALFGARADAFCDGCIRMALPNGGGLAGTPGGLGLITSFTPVTPGAGTVATAIGAYASTPQNAGTSQFTSTAHNNCSWTLDLIDLQAAAAWTTYVKSTQSGPSSYQAGSSDGSGLVTKLQCHWCSVYPANGTTVGSLPSPQTSWTSSSPFTAAIMNGSTGIPQLMNLLNMPPAAAVVTTAGTSCANGADTLIGSWGTAAYDTYGGFASSTYTAPLPGLYLVYGMVPWPDGYSGYSQSGLVINGTFYFGPRSQTNSGGGQGTNTAKAGIYSLQAGDTIQLAGRQNVGSTISCYSGARMIVLYLGASGVPSFIPELPDVTYRWQAGTPNSSMASLLNAHLANDLLFLLQRPYLLAYQSAAQTGIAMSTTTPVVMQATGGLVHGDNGDNYSGWSSANNWYVAPVNGWYLALQETSMAVPTLTSTPTVIAGFVLNPAGATNADLYQQQITNTAILGGGAAALGYYYLRAGDTIQPIVFTQDSSSTTTATSVTMTNSHFEVVWLGE